MNKEGKTELNTKNGNTITKIKILATALSILNDWPVMAKDGGAYEK